MLTVQTENYVFAGDSQATDKSSTALAEVIRELKQIEDLNGYGGYAHKQDTGFAHIHSMSVA